MGVHHDGLYGPSRIKKVYHQRRTVVVNVLRPNDETGRFEDQDIETSYDNVRVLPELRLYHKKTKKRRKR